jgi:glycosyltransferase involved in cell wall biosynthesis
MAAETAPVDSASVDLRDQEHESEKPEIHRGQFRPGSPRVSVIIPTLNEESNLPAVLQDLPSFLQEVIIVDGLSQDRTVEVARTMRPDCQIVLESKRGKGAAVRAGLRASRGEYVIILDADYSHDPAEIVRMIERLDEGYDLVHGSRFLPGGGSSDLTPFRLLGNRLFVLITNLLHGSHYTDVCYGYLAMRRQSAVRLAVMADGMEIDAELLILAHRARLKISEVPSFERKRLSGRSRLHPVRDGWRIVWKIVHHYLAGRPSQGEVGEQLGGERA